MSKRFGTELILQMIFAVRCTAADILLRLLLKAASLIEEKKYQFCVTNGVHSLVHLTDATYYHEKEIQ